MFNRLLSTTPLLWLMGVATQLTSWSVTFVMESFMAFTSLLLARFWPVSIRGVSTRAVSDF